MHGAVQKVIIAPEMDDAQYYDKLDLALAAELQAALLPKDCPTNCPNQKVAARNRMCASVGGDFYGFIRANNDQTVIFIADVVGHGIRASLVMAQIIGYLHSQPTSLTRPKEQIANLNQMLIDLGNRTDSVIPCSMLYGVIDAPSGSGFFVNAGHYSPILCLRGTCEYIDLGSHNLMLGIEEFDYIESCHSFASGERIILYTDGLIEALNEKDESFGEQRLQELARQHISDTPDECADGIFRAIEEFRQGQPQRDDETIVVIDRV